MKEQTANGDRFGNVSSVFGRLVPIFVPEAIAADVHGLTRGVIAQRYGLLPAQIDLLEILMSELTINQIADKLFSGDVKRATKRISALYSRLGVKRREGAMLAAARLGLIPDKDLAPQGEISLPHP